MDQLICRYLGVERGSKRITNKYAIIKVSVKSHYRF